MANEAGPLRDNGALTPLQRGGAHNIPPLTSLRFFAAAMIVIQHLRGFWGIPSHFADVNFGQGVSFFFVLSGFILAYVYPKLPTRQLRARFFLARFARVWPGHMAALVLAFIVLTSHASSRSPAWVAFLNVAMLHSWVPVRAVFGSFNSVSWSISTEFSFYLIFPLLIHNFARNWFWKLALAAACVVGLTWLCEAFGLPPTASGDWELSTEDMMREFPPARLLEFVLGMVTALGFQHIRGRLHISRALGTLLEVAVLGLLVVNALRGMGIVSGLRTGGWINPGIGFWLVHGGVCCASFMLVIVVFACESGWISRLLSRPAFVLLGEISFAIYLLHRIPIAYVSTRVQEFDGFPDWLQLGVYLTLLLASSHAIWTAIERPLRARIVAIWPDPAAPPSGGDAGSGTREPRSVWRARLKTLAPEVAIVAVIVTSVAMVGQRGAGRIALEAPGIASYAERTPEATRDTVFGDVCLLRGATIRSDRGGLLIELAWEPLRDLPGDVLVAVHLLDPKGRIVGQADYRQAAAAVTAGPFLERRIVRLVPETATHVGIAVVLPETDTPLPVSKGPRDWDGRRLLLDLPER